MNLHALNNVSTGVFVALVLLSVALGVALGTTADCIARRFTLQGSVRGTQCPSYEKSALRRVVAALVCASYFVSVLLVFGLTVQTLALWALGCCLLGLSLVDIDCFVIPNCFLIAGVTVWIVYVAVLYATGSPDAQSAVSGGLLGAVLIAVIVLVLSLATGKVTGKQSLGGGDIKLLFVTGLFLGITGSLFSLFVACIVGIAFALARKTGKGEPFAFGPAISIGTWTCLLLVPAVF